MGYYNFSYFAINQYGMSVNLTVQIQVITAISASSSSSQPTSSSSSSPTSSSSSSTPNYTEGTDCIPQRYPMILGDSFSSGSKQTLTCFGMYGYFGSQIVGGSTTSYNMASHASMSAESPTKENIQSTIFLINLDSAGMVKWNKQYYNELTQSDPTQFFY